MKFSKCLWTWRVETATLGEWILTEILGDDGKLIQTATLYDEEWIQTATLYDGEWIQTATLGDDREWIQTVTLGDDGEWIQTATLYDGECIQTVTLGDAWRVDSDSNSRWCMESGFRQPL